jgi:hypothetical protein
VRWDPRPVFLFQLNTFGYSHYVTYSPTRGWVCRLQLLLVFASEVIPGSESLGTHDHILLPQIRVSPDLEGQIPVFTSPETGWPGYTPRHWVPFSSSPTTRTATVEVFDPVAWDPRYTASGRLPSKQFPNNSSVVIEVYLPRHCVAMEVIWLLLAYSLPRNKFTEQLSSNGRLLWFHYSGFRALCHNMTQAA